MEKNYNDDELSDIMKAIEELEKESYQNTQDFPENKEELSSLTNSVSDEDGPLEPVLQEDSEVNELEDDVLIDLVNEIEAVGKNDELIDNLEQDDDQVLDQIQESLSSEDHSERNVFFEEQALKIVSSKDKDSISTTMKENEMSKKPIKKIDDTSNMPLNKNKSTKVSHETSNEVSKESTRVINLTIDENIKLNLNLIIEGQLISLNTSDEGFEIKLESGLKFQMPVNFKKAS